MFILFELFTIVYTVLYCVLVLSFSKMWIFWYAEPVQPFWAHLHCLEFLNKNASSWPIFLSGTETFACLWKKPYRMLSTMVRRFNFLSLRPATVKNCMSVFSIFRINLLLQKSCQVRLQQKQQFLEGSLVRQIILIIGATTPGRTMTAF